MSVYRKVLEVLLRESDDGMKNIPGLDTGVTKLAPGLMIGDEQFNYTIIRIDRSDPDNLLYTIRSYGRYDGDGYYDKIIDSKEIKKYKRV